jgi:hypothetical protein
MLARPQNKMTVALVALSIGVALVSFTAAISRFAPSGWAGTVVWVVSLVVAVPLAIAAFNAVCDYFLYRSSSRATSESRLDSYWPSVQSDLANQFHLNGARLTNGLAHVNGTNNGVLGPSAIPIDPLRRPATMEQRRHKWWVGQ